MPAKEAQVPGRARAEVLKEDVPVLQRSRVRQRYGEDWVEGRTIDSVEESSGAQRYREALETVQIRTFIGQDGFAPAVNLVL